MKGRWGLWLTACAVLVFVLSPLVMLFPRGLEADSLRRLAESSELQSALSQSLALAFVSATLATACGLMIAFALPLYSARFRQWVNRALVFPMVLPEIAVGISYMVWFVKWGLGLGWMTLILSHSAFCLSYATLILKNRVESLDWRLKDAARDLGAGGLSVFRHALWPQIKAATLSAFLLCFCLSLDDFLISFFVKGIDQDLLPVRIFSMMRLRIPGEIYSLSVGLLCISMGVVLVSGLWLKSKRRFRSLRP